MLYCLGPKNKNKRQTNKNSEKPTKTKINIRYLSFFCFANFNQYFIYGFSKISNLSKFLFKTTY